MRLSRFNLLGRLGLQFSITIVAVIQQIILVSIFSIHWSPALYGSWLIMMAASNILIVFDLGLHSYTYIVFQQLLTRRESHSATDFVEAAGRSVTAYLMVSASIILVAVPACWLLPLPNWLGLTGASDEELRLSLFLSILSGTALILGYCFSAILRAYDILNAVTFLRIVHIAFGTIGMIGILRYEFGIVAAAAAWMTIQWLLTAALIAFCVQHVPRLWDGISKANFLQSRATFRSSRRYIIALSSELVVTNIPTLIIGALGRPGAEVILFSLTRTLTAFIRQIATFATFPGANEVGHLWAQKNGPGTRKAILLSVALSGVSTGVLTGYFASFGPQIMILWTHGTYHSDNVILALLLLNVAMVFPAICAYTALMFTNQPELVTRSKIRQIAILLIACVVFGSFWGARGTSAAILVAELLAATLPLAASLQSRFQIAWRPYLTSLLVPFSAGLAISVASAFASMQMNVSSGLTRLIVQSFGWLPLPALVAFYFFYLYTRPEKD